MWSDMAMDKGRGQDSELTDTYYLKNEAQQQRHLVSHDVCCVAHSSREDWNPPLHGLALEENHAHKKRVTIHSCC